MHVWFNDTFWPETYQQLFLIYYYYAGCYVWSMSEMVKYKGSVLLKRPKSGPVYQIQDKKFKKVHPRPSF